MAFLFFNNGLIDAGSCGAIWSITLAIALNGSAASSGLTDIVFLAWLTLPVKRLLVVSSSVM